MTRPLVHAVTWACVVPAAAVVVVLLTEWVLRAVRKNTRTR